MTKRELVRLLKSVPDAAEVLGGRNPIHVIIESEKQDFVVLDDSVAAFLIRTRAPRNCGRVLFNNASESVPTEAAA